MSTFINLLHEIFSDFGSITTRKMIGLIADGTHYLKADDVTK